MTKFVKIYTNFIAYSLFSDDKKMIFEYANLILNHEDSIDSIFPLMAASILKEMSSKNLTYKIKNI